MKSSKGGIGTAIDEDLIRRAENVDRSIANDETQSPLDQAMQDPPPVDVSPAAPVDVVNDTSALKQTFCVLLQLTIARLHSEWDWSDPGDEWRDQVGNNLGLLADRYIGDLASSHTIEISLAFLILPWVIENAVSKGFPKKPPKAAPEGSQAGKTTATVSARGDGIREEYVGPIVAPAA